MHLEIICTADGLSQFAPEWSAFAKSQPHVTPFQLPEWLIPWWSHFGSGSPRIFVFRESECVGLFPAFLHEWNGARQITLMGSGISDYLDPLFNGAHAPAILNCLREYLATSDDWDICNWQDLSYGTQLHLLSGEHWSIEKQQEVICTEVQLANNFELFWEHRPRHLHRNVRRGEKQAGRNGSLTFQVSAEAEPSLMNALMRLHAAEWNVHGQPGMIETNHSAGFLRDVARQFAEYDMLRLFTLHYRDEIAAIILALVCQGTVYGYLTGFDPAYKSLSVASILLYHSLQECYRQGFRAWNFCRGDEHYKAEWGAQAIRRCRLVLHRNRS